MSLWEFLAMVDGFRTFHGGEKPRGGDEMDDDRLADLGIEGF